MSKFISNTLLGEDLFTRHSQERIVIITLLLPDMRDMCHRIFNH